MSIDLSLILPNKCRSLRDKEEAQACFYDTMDRIVSYFHGRKELISEIIVGEYGMIHPVMTQMTVRPSTRTVICKNCKVARLVQKSPKPVGDLGERDQLTRRGFSSEGLGFGCGWENGCIWGPINGKVKG